VLSVLLPTLDEAPNLRELLPELLAVLDPDDELLVLDDGSTDGTQDVVRTYAARDPRVRLIERRGRPSLTAALQEGIDAARGDLVGWMDADGAMRAPVLVRLRGAIEREGLDLVVGSRFLEAGRIKGQRREGLLGRLEAMTRLGDSGDPWIGVLLSWALNGLVLPAILQDGVHDYTSGFAIARRAVLARIRLRGDHGEYFIDLFVRAKALGFRVGEVAYAIQPRRHGVSKTAESLRDYGRRGRQYLTLALVARAARRGAP
jgi:dolichol-phosphate mannosyltransferase